MTSTIAWLDASSEEQRRMRDIIRLFADRDSRDELGLGQVRDAIGDILFPGTSTLHTRARYLLFIPWIYQEAAARNKKQGWASAQERKLISAIRSSEDSGGLLGSRAGQALKTLPSSIYWAALGTYRIRLDNTFTRELALESSSSDRAAEPGEGGRFSIWSPTMPKAPESFPGEVPDGFAMTHDEAAWLRERMLTAAPDSLFAHLLEHPPDSSSKSAWLDSSALSATGNARQWLDDAHRFSSVMHGAQLLYNLLLAELHRSEGYRDDDQYIDRYRNSLGKWQEGLAAIDLAEAGAVRQMLNRIHVDRDRPIHPRSTAFITAWYDIVRELGSGQVADSRGVREFVRKREISHKGSLSRLKNPKRLQNWAGGSGAGALNYRWSYVQGTIGDIFDGLARDQSEVVNA